MTFGDDCIGVVLSGYLDDGTIGAIEIDEYEGTMIAQAPSDAEQPSMPLNVIRRDSPDYILPDILIGGTLRDLVAGRAARAEGGDRRGVAGRRVLSGVAGPVGPPRQAPARLSASNASSRSRRAAGSSAPTSAASAWKRSMSSPASAYSAAKAGTKRR